MRIYLAGGITAGNLYPFWNHAMKIYLAGTLSRPYVIEEAIKLYLAGGNDTKWKGDMHSDIRNQKPYILESFFYIRNHKEWILKMRPFFSDFMLDSGAFTYINGLRDRPCWDSYIEEYATFINDHRVDLFFELDIDHLVGLGEVERLRAKLEAHTGKKSIPVWHKSRGLDYWKAITKDYNYVAIGGIVSKEIKRNEYPIFTPLLKIAYDNGCKVHGLGFTSIDGMRRYKFHSVDSTSWVHGNIGGYLYLFKDGGITQVKAENKKLLGRRAAVHNFGEWLKFSKFAEQYL
jgi:hypothetical protein